MNLIRFMLFLSRAFFSFNLVLVFLTVMMVVFMVVIGDGYNCVDHCIGFGEDNLMLWCLMGLFNYNVR